MQSRSIVAVAVLGIALIGSTAAAEGPERFDGLCDASAGVERKDGTLLVADDEKDAIWLATPGQRTLTSILDLKTFLSVKAGEESDIEAAARVEGQDRVYWISSHSNDSDGNFQESRLRLFATTTGERAKISTVGAYYAGLRDDLARAPALRDFDLAAKMKGQPEAADGFSIEGLATTPKGTLLIGFRNPLPKGRALVVEITNPDDLIKPGTKAKAAVGAVIQLDLGKDRGVRSLEWVGDSYVIIAGPFGGGGAFAAFRWVGPSSTELTPIAWPLATEHPEAVMAVKNGLRILSDRGDERINDGKRCKKLPDQDPGKYFTSVVFPSN